MVDTQLNDQTVLFLTIPLSISKKKKRLNGSKYWYLSLTSQLTTWHDFFCTQSYHIQKNN